MLEPRPLGTFPKACPSLGSPPAFGPRSVRAPQVSPHGHRGRYKQGLPRAVSSEARMPAWAPGPSPGLAGTIQQPWGLGQGAEWMERHRVWGQSSPALRWDFHTVSPSSHPAVTVTVTVWTT